MIDNNETLTEYTPDMITRREAVARVAALLGGVALIGGSALITGCRTEKTAGTTAFTPFTTDEVAYLDEIADTILPTTSTPGAKAAKTGEFMARIVTDSYNDKDQQTFRDGMVKLNDASKKANGGKAFMEATPEQRLALLKTLDKEQFDRAEKDRLENLRKSKEFISQSAQQPSSNKESEQATSATADPPNRYFRMMKELSLLGYFTSEIGCTQAQVYEESPGKYEPCIPYTPGQKSYADHA